jgi:Tfp pilus assembly protein PilF
LAYLEARQPKAAAAEFRKILDHRGVVMNSPLGALAHLQLARAELKMGDKPAAREAYRDFLNIWKDADPANPVLIQAQSEYRSLN